MSKTLLVLITLVLCACGQQAGPKQTQAGERKSQTRAAVTAQKGHIVQPAVKVGKRGDASSVLISFHGCADLLLIDPRGRKLGYDADGQKNYLGIEGGIYDEGNPIDDEDDQKQEVKAAEKQSECIVDKTVQVPNPISGTYTLKMGGQTRTAFNLEITSYGPDSKANGHYALSQLVGSAPPLNYQFQLPPSSDARLEVKDSAQNTD